MAERIGIYGGSFDPVHLGHLILARDAIELLGLSRLIFVPAAVSPHKLDQEPRASAQARLEMLTAATAAEGAFAVDPCELDRSGPSFSIDTVDDLRRRVGPDAAFFYMIGEDNVRALHTWHRIDELRALVTFVVFRRRRQAADPATIGAGAEFPVLERVVDLSSTEIRKRVASGLPIRYLVPEAVEAIIARDGLYRTLNAAEGALSSPPKN